MAVMAFWRDGVLLSRGVVSDPLRNPSRTGRRPKAIIDVCAPRVLLLTSGSQSHCSRDQLSLSAGQITKRVPAANNNGHHLILIGGHLHKAVWCMVWTDISTGMHCDGLALALHVEVIVICDLGRD